jgi:hypothetical protein
VVSVASTTVATAFEVAIGTIHFHCATVATDYSFKMGLVVSSRSCHEWERGVMRERVERTKQQVTVDVFFLLVMAGKYLKAWLLHYLKNPVCWWHMFLMQGNFYADYGHVGAKPVGCLE